MNTTYTWPELRQHAIDAFAGDTPGQAIEDRVTAHFQTTPARVATLIDGIGRRVQAGTVRSGWAILDRELNAKPANIQATDNRERGLQFSLAETWIRNTGAYLDRESELVDALFGDQGPLRQWPDMQAHMVEVWAEQRPRFRRTERAALKRQRRQAKVRQLRRLIARHEPEPDTSSDLPF